MTALETTLRFINIFFATLVGGAQVLVLLAIVPVKRRWSLDMSLILHQEMLIVPPDRYLKPSVGVTFVSAIGLLLLQGGLTSTSAILTAFGALCTLGVMLTSHFFNFKINAVIGALPREPAPAAYPALQQRWDGAHTVRTAFGVLAMAAFILAGLMR